MLRVFLMALDEVPDDVQGAPELPLPVVDVDDPELLRPPLDVAPVLVRDPVEDRVGITKGSMRKSPRVS